MIIINIYWPPAGNCKRALEKLADVCSGLTNNHKRYDFLIIGDININSLTDSPNLRSLNEFRAEFGLISNVTIPTRESINSSSSIDIIFSYMNYVSRSGIISSSLSDHYPLFLVKKKNVMKHQKISFTGRSYRDFDSITFGENLQYYNWGRYYAAFDVDTAWDELYGVILAEADRMCPIMNFNIKNKRPDWYSDELMELSVNRDWLFREAKLHKNEDKLKQASELRNLVKTGVTNSRAEYFTKLINDNHDDPVRFWTCIKKLIPDSKDNAISTVLDPVTNSLCKPTETADAINRYFSEIGRTLDSQIDHALDPQTRTPQVRELILENNILVHLVIEHLQDFKASKPSGCPKI